MRTKKGTVVNTLEKTAVVEVTTYKTHPIYKKRYKVTSRYKAHDESNSVKIGDEITIYESRPYSKTKTWSVEKPKTNK